ncbi:MAG: mechanosensitive ion channel family protein [Anaerolineales bacterium]|nr:mechanosensitive ion channel family protein [Anaerolineales bacterium]
MDWLNTVLFGDTLQNWLLAMLIVIGVIVAFRLAEAIIVRRVRAFAQRTTTRADDFVVDLLRQTQLWFLLLVAAWLGSLVLTPDEMIRIWIVRVVTIALFVQMAVWGNSAINFGVLHYKRERLDEDAGSVTVLSALGLIAKLVMWVIVLLLILDNFGIEVTSLIAGLGISGIAVALAVQNILGDLFASLSIVLDKPFVIGDTIIVGDFVGTVEKIGLKTTRVRSLSGEQLVFSNTDLLQSRIRNFKTLQERRVLFLFGVEYETPPQKLAAIPEMVETAVSSQPQTRFDRAHFKSFDDSALTFEVVYYVTVADFVVYMDTQQAINLALVERFTAEGIGFAYPTRTLVVRQGERAVQPK